MKKGSCNDTNKKLEIIRRARRQGDNHSQGLVERVWEQSVVERAHARAETHAELGLDPRVQRIVVNQLKVDSAVASLDAFSLLQVKPDHLFVVVLAAAADHPGARGRRDQDGIRLGQTCSGVGLQDICVKRVLEGQSFQFPNQHQAKQDYLCQLLRQELKLINKTAAVNTYIISCLFGKQFVLFHASSMVDGIVHFCKQKVTRFSRCPNFHVERANQEFCGSTYYTSPWP
jgi:hypothetical protein